MSRRLFQAPFGELEWEERLGWWESQPIPVPLFGGEKARFTISPFVADTSGPLDQNAIDAADAFLALSPSALAEIEPHVWQYSREMAEIWEDCPDVRREALWTHVRLNGIGIDYDDDGVAYVNVECNCDWEPEHGLQLVLQNGVRWVRVSDYSGHLTEGDAYACPELDAWMQDENAKLPVRSREETFALLGKFKRGKR